MEAYNGSADTFTSLAAVSYLTKTVKTTQLALENGWQSSRSQYQTGNPACGVCNGVVYLSGSMHTAGQRHRPVDTYPGRRQDQRRRA